MYNIINYIDSLLIIKIIKWAAVKVKTGKKR